MQKYKKAAINIAFLTMILTVGISNSFLFSSDFDSDIDLNNKKAPKYIQEKQEKVTATLEQSDYQTWKKLIGKNNKINSLINESDFQLFVEARSAARNGRYDKAIEITDKITEKIKKQTG